MTERLSPDQVAALVEAAKEGRAPERERPRRSPRVREIDFSRPTKLTQDQQRRVARGHESFCRSAGTQLSAELRTPVELEVLHVSQLTWFSALGEIPQPSVYAVLAVEPLGTRMLLSAELAAVRRLITRLLGGFEDGRQEERGLTEIEVSLARRILATLVDSLSLTWQDLLGVQLRLAELEAQLHSIQLAPPSEPSLAVTVELRQQGSSSTLSLLVPYRAIEPVAGHLQGSLRYGEIEPADAAYSAGRIVRASLAKVEVEVRAEVAAVEMTIDQVLALRAGSLIRLGAPVQAGVSLLVGDLPLHRARPGRAGRRRAALALDCYGGRT